MAEHQCWFCGQRIDRSDAGATLITIENLWRYDGSSARKDDPLQQVYAHADCARARLHGATMAIEPSIFDEDE